MAVHRQVEAVLAEIEKARKTAKYEKIRHYLQLVSLHVSCMLLSSNLLMLLINDLGITSIDNAEQVREFKTRDSENVALLGSQLLRSYRHRLTEEECKRGFATVCTYSR